MKSRQAVIDLAEAMYAADPRTQDMDLLEDNGPQAAAVDAIERAKLFYVVVDGDPDLSGPGEFDILPTEIPDFMRN